jgi:putative endonuclease
VSATGAQRRGRWAEDLACDHLHRAGLETVTRNYRGRRGEIDLVMRCGETLVFVEVRYRGRQDFGSGAESVDEHKRRKLIATAHQFLQRHPQGAGCPCRFDVISITAGGDAPRIEWIQNAFDA